jgi:CsoR family transcriptional regulator, copper-sensing transcriptional repressor
MEKFSQKDVNLLLKTAKGQLEAVLKMYDNDRYCVDIATQILAISSLLKKANNLIIQDHIQSCVKDAMNDQSVEEKLKEVSELLTRINQ